MAKKADAEKERLAKAEREKANMAATAAQNELNGRVVKALRWVWELLAKGDAPEADLKRWNRRPELSRLLLSDGAALRVISHETDLPRNMSIPI